MIPFEPFQLPVPLAGAGACDSPLVCVSFSQAWLPYVLTCLKALLMDSSWASTDMTALAANRQAAQQLMENFMVDGCVPAVEFQLNPDNPCLMQYSLDGGVTWVDMPDTLACLAPPPDVSHFLVDNPGAVRANFITPESGSGDVGIEIST